MPWHIGALAEDGQSGKPGRKRDKLKATARSLSPFRHHSHKRSNSGSGIGALALPGTSRSRSKGSGRDKSKTLGVPAGDVDPESGDESRGEETDAEGDNDSVTSGSSRKGRGLTPRNNAFSADSDAEAEDDEWENVARPEGGSPESALAPSEPHTDGTDAEPKSDTEQSRDETTDDEEDEDDYIDFDDETIDNTLHNAGCIGLHDAWKHDEEHEHRSDLIGAREVDNAAHEDDEHLAAAPNVVLGEAQRPPKPKRQGSKVLDGEHALTASRPVFERNRCTITLVHGEYEEAARQNKRPKRYVVASDGSDEASYAIEWCIGTVLRDGDETLVCSVMETDAKLDASNPAHEDKSARQENQKLRQSMAVILARQATAVLQRTRLGVKVSCQAIHARNSRHMICDLLDYYSPTMCIVGSRGLGSLKGILLGSTSHYLVQKSPVPVMVARKRLRLPALPRVKNDVVLSVRERHMRLDQAAIEKDSNVAEENPDHPSSTGQDHTSKGDDIQESKKSDGLDDANSEHTKKSDLNERVVQEDEDATSLAHLEGPTADKAGKAPQSGTESAVALDRAERKHNEDQPLKSSNTSEDTSSSVVSEDLSKRDPALQKAKSPEELAQAEVDRANSRTAETIVEEPEVSDA
ncbi:hypothetical protein IE81DRAFT_227190 [Ceraceosorus guamensis]|uniref:UspA domain-containing protein n=1 Tax=Ceraceosorus guamensis TaxID=1522189 RepID=A0A316W5M7_9BASI|nr:hypothetical protein IE81DRAFT_227190 [Ceraceosorus guamensis]PWN45052.1 hypothetical protein IE81DRAFT_227190 [Ceraceosorus guamensis]